MFRIVSQSHQFQVHFGLFEREFQVMKTFFLHVAVTGVETVVHEFVEISFFGDLGQPDLLRNEFFNQETGVFGVLIPDAFDK